MERRRSTWRLVMDPPGGCQIIRPVFSLCGGIKNGG